MLVPIMVDALVVTQPTAAGPWANLKFDPTIAAKMQRTLRLEDGRLREA